MDGKDLIGKIAYVYDDYSDRVMEVRVISHKKRNFAKNLPFDEVRYMAPEDAAVKFAYMPPDDDELGSKMMIRSRLSILHEDKAFIEAVACLRYALPRIPQGASVDEAVDFFIKQYDDRMDDARNSDYVRNHPETCLETMQGALQNIIGYVEPRKDGLQSLCLSGSEYQVMERLEEKLRTHCFM